MMTAHSNNPFILPGLGQTGESASNPLFASLEMMRQTFSTLSGANGLTKGLGMQATLDPAELEKKISELKSVESWLKLNLSMLSSTIQGMEVQLATITTLKQFMSANNATPQQGWPHFAPTPTSTSTSTPAPTPAPASEPSFSPAPTSAPSSSFAATSGTPVPPAEETSGSDAQNTDAAQAWWNMLTQQFGQLAAATKASMGATPAAKQSVRATQAAKKKKSATVKTVVRARTTVKKPNARSTTKK